MQTFLKIGPLVTTSVDLISHSPLFPAVSFIFERSTSNLHTLLKPPNFIQPTSGQARGPRILVDLEVLTFWLALFCSLFKLCLHLSTLKTQ